MGLGSCKGRSLEMHWTSTVTAATTVGPGIPAVGDVISAYLCVHFRYHDHSEQPTTIKIVRGTEVSL
jgi:hypothetical protein